MMKFYKNIFNIIVLTLLIQNDSFAQFSFAEADKCGFNKHQAKLNLQVFGDHWGYSYDSLLTDLDKWTENPFITIDSLGASVQNRAIWQLAITSNEIAVKNKQTVFIHARTHPGEVQSWWVTEQVINQLTADSDIARALREQCVFYIIPMYNPDGVELEYPRQNANEIDIESNWANNPPEPEVQVLRARFTELMESTSPIKVAMNMHSAYGTERFFVYHDSVGTSPAFTVLEQAYIEGVRFYYFEGIEPWYYRITWKSGTPTYYPESWFWINHREAVMALTYEDWNDEHAHSFDLTANAILNGIADYLDIQVTGIDPSPLLAGNFNLLSIAPNPFNPLTTIRYELKSAGKVILKIYDLSGQEIANPVNDFKPAGSHHVRFNGSSLSSGLYIAELRINNQRMNKKMLLVK